LSNYLLTSLTIDNLSYIPKSLARSPESYKHVVNFVEISPLIKLP